jgi:hypothetical protein
MSVEYGTRLTELTLLHLEDEVFIALTQHLFEILNTSATNLLLDLRLRGPIAKFHAAIRLR